MRDNVPVQFQGKVRKVAARLRVANERPQFTEFPAQETSNTYTQFCQYVQNGQCYQWAMAEGDSNLYMTGFNLNDDINPISRVFGIATGPFISGTPISENHRALAVKDSTVYGALNGIIYQQVYVSKVGYQWNQVVSLVDPVTSIQPEITLLAISPTMLVAAAVYASNNVADRCKLIVIENGVVDTWKGYLPKHSHRPNLAAMQTSDGTIHIYVDDWSGKRPVYIRRFNAKIWSATRQILPMDAVDEDSLFSVGYASQLTNGRVFLTGTIKRQFGTGYTVYMLGPDKVTFGRDLIIKTDYLKPLMIAEGDGKIWAVGKDDIFLSPLTPGIFSTETPTTQADVFRFTLDMPTNGADRLSLELPAKEITENSTDLVAGAMLELDVLANDQTYTLGRYGVDRYRFITQQEGQNFQVDCSSYAMKKLVDWESDTYFDYMGQGEAHGDPGDLTKLIRFSGSHYTAPVAGGLQIESLNEDGMCYTVNPSSHGGFIRAKFTNVQAKDVMLGVGLNYGEESLAEAAARLNKRVEEVAAGERGRWALIALYNPDPIGGPTGKGKVMLLDYNTLRKGNLESPTAVNPWKQVNYAFVDRVTTALVIAMQYQDGYARVYFAGMDTPDLQLVISDETALDWDLHPTEHENYGRGLLFMRNNTGFHMSYPVMSDSDVIPLYDGIAKADKYYYPLEDRTDKFTIPGTCIIDSERIYYAGIAGYTDNRRVSTDLQWLPGKVVARAGDGIATPTGTDTDFAKSRGTGSGGSHVHGNNYVLQIMNLTDGTILTAVRVWLKKVNFPEDGVTLTINQGNVGGSANAVALVGNILATGTSMSASQLKSEGGWVTFYLDRDLTIKNIPGFQYWIMIRRNKNWNHPTSASYFQYKKMADSTYPNAGCYVFCEEDDAAVGQSGDMAFVAYARVDDPNKEYMFPVVYQSAVGLSSAAASTYWSGSTPTASQNWWTGCAITITKGAGINNCYRISRAFRLTDSLNDLFCFAIDRDPGKIFGTDTMARAVPALYGLKRGQNDATGTATLAAAHGDKSMVHVPRDTFAKSTYFEYYTADEDLTLAEVTESIARKAGVIDVDLCNRHPGSVTSTTSPYIYLPAISKNLVLSLDIPILGGASDSVAVSFVDSLNHDVMLAQVHIINTMGVTSGWITIGYTDWYFNDYTGYWNAYANNVLSLPFDDMVKGDFRLSLYDGHMAVWCGGRLLGAANMGAGLKDWTKYRVTTSTGTVKVMVPQAGTRVDNFVMDMGKSGASLLSLLIGEKRVYYRDDGTGKLKIYTDRETVPGAYNRASTVQTETTDIGLATRVLLEGGEVVEVSSAGNLEKYGNFFKTFNFNEINNLDDAKYFADVVLEDMTLNREQVEVEGAADPRIEPTDIITLQLAANSTRDAVIDQISHEMYVDQAEAVYDMRLSGRFKE
jgi:hypothetical protein